MARRRAAKRTHAQVARKAHQVERTRQRRALGRRRRTNRLRTRRAPWWRYSTLEVDWLESGFPPEYEGFTRQAVGHCLLYRGIIDVPEVGQRRVAISFPGPPSRVAPIVMTDGPKTLRHRYQRIRPTALCIWHPRDPNSLRWTPDHRLVGLIDLIRVHLLKEAWFRATERWPSPEVHRNPDERPRRIGPSARTRDHRQRCWCGSRRYTSCHGQRPADDEIALLGLAA